MVNVAALERARKGRSPRRPGLARRQLVSTGDEDDVEERSPVCTDHPPAAWHSPPDRSPAQVAPVSFEAPPRVSSTLEMLAENGTAAELSDPTGGSLTAASRAPHAEYRPDVDGLRAVAVVAVILFHMDASWLPGGFVGVDVFFVISGFVVSGSLLRKQQPSSAAFLAAFYARRVKRLAPALIAVVFITSLLLAYNLSAWMPALDGYLVSGMFALVGWANQHFATLPTGYFDEGADGLQWNPFTHCWSLGVEEYLCEGVRTTRFCTCGRSTSAYSRCG